MQDNDFHAVTDMFYDTVEHGGNYQSAMHAMLEACGALDLVIIGGRTVGGTALCELQGVSHSAGHTFRTHSWREEKNTMLRTQLSCAQCRLCSGATDDEAAVISDDGCGVLCQRLNPDEHCAVRVAVRFRNDHRARLMPALQAFIPGLLDALQLRWKLEDLRYDAQYQQAIVQALPVPILIVNPHGNVLVANEYGQAWADKASSYLSNGISSPSLRRSLQTLAAEAISQGQAFMQSFSCSPTQSMEPGGMTYLMAAPLPDDDALDVAWSAGAPSEERVLIIVCEGNEIDSEGEEVLGALFGLSSAEASLAKHLVNTGSLDHAAVKTGVAKETARSQLKSVFAKTKVHTQADLVRFLGPLTYLRRPPASAASQH
jgi:DNA-binding CsgD family transcriptional regulator/PAS domain-containing protein